MLNQSVRLKDGKQVTIISAFGSGDSRYYYAVGEDNRPFQILEAMIERPEEEKVIPIRREIKEEAEDLIVNFNRISTSADLVRKIPRLSRAAASQVFRVTRNVEVENLDSLKDLTSSLNLDWDSILEGISLQFE